MSIDRGSLFLAVRPLDLRVRRVDRRLIRLIVDDERGDVFELGRDPLQVLDQPDRACWCSS